MTEPYIPSNGTDGDIFVRQWCARCACDELANGRDEDGRDCPILTASYAGQKELEKFHPGRWVEDADGPRCLAHVPYTGQPWVDPVEADRDRTKYDALPRDPVTGRPVIA